MTKAKVNEHGEIDIVTTHTADSLSPEDVDPFYADRMLEIDARAKAREEKLVKEAEAMSQSLNFEEVTKAVAGFE